MILTVGNTKGGTGKTTLAVQLALALARTGRDVLLIDGDRQGTAQIAVAQRAEAGAQPPLACVQYTDGRVLREQVRLQAPRYQDVVIDAGGRDSATLRAALVVSDVLLVPFLPRSVDVWALADIAELIEEARTVRSGLTTLAVLNCADPGASPDNSEALAALADLPQLTGVNTAITRRKAFANATGRGLSIDELTPVDPKAIGEMVALLRNVLSFADTMTINGG